MGLFMVLQPRILVLIDFFLPGEKAGGPVRTLAALMHHLGERALFLVVTRDRDLGDQAPYPDVVPGRWLAAQGGWSRYLASSHRSPRAIARLLRSTPHDVLYLNTVYSVPFGLLPLTLRKCGLVPRRRTVVAPRGQLHPGALRQKLAKKLPFLVVARASRIFDDVVWQASSPNEATQIRRWFGRKADVRVAPNLRIALSDEPDPGERHDGPPLRVAFVSRISPKKNLIGALEILARVSSPVVFDIYGAREDAAYWRRCESAMRALPQNIRATYRGILPGAEVHATLARRDLLLLPTFGENYGHVIAEALAAGCPPLISNRTPWRDLVDSGAGWDLPVGDHDEFKVVLEMCAHESATRRAARAAGARRLVAAQDSDSERLRANAQLLGVSHPL